MRQIESLNVTTHFKVEDNFDTEIKFKEKLGTYSTFVMKKPGEKVIVPACFATENLPLGNLMLIGFISLKV